jgi:cysteine synthase A
VTLLCDDGRRYAHSYYDDAWVAARGWDLAGPTRVLDHFLATGTWDEGLGGS